MRRPVYDILKSETERVARIVRQMLGLYRNTEQVGNFDVNAVVEDTLLLFARQLDRAGVRVAERPGQRCRRRWVRRTRSGRCFPTW